MSIDAAKLRDLADAILDKHKVPGAALSVIKKGEVVFRHLYGVTSLDSKQPMTEHAMFDIGSISKTFNAATMALLVDEGLLDWDDYVIDRLPGWRLIDPTVTPHAQLRDLVGQSLGLGEDNITNYFSHFTRRQIIDQIRYLPLRVPFRSECTYQSYGPVTAGAVVERLSGQSWEDFVEQRIARTLGFSDTFASYFRLRDTSSACDPHFVQEDGKCVTIPHRNFDNLAPAGSMTSSLRDLERWFTLFAQKGELDGKRFLRAETVEQMLRPRTAVQPDGIHPQRYLSRFEASFVTYGLGFYAHDFGGRRINEHTGALEGFSSSAAPSRRRMRRSSSLPTSISVRRCTACAICCWRRPSTCRSRIGKRATKWRQRRARRRRCGAANPISGAQPSATRNLCRRSHRRPSSASTNIRASAA
jgi:CubicO group peptidase (beta-lactamase class C family)